MSDETPEKRSRLRRLTPLVLGLTLFALGIFALSHLMRSVHPAEVLAQIRAISPVTLTAAILATAVSYASMIGYDWWALRYVDHKLPTRAVAMGSFLGFAFGNTVGISVVSGGAVRYRIYSALGLNAFEVAAVSSYIALAMGTGLTLIGLGALVIHPAALGSALPLPLIRWGALAILTVTLGTLVALARPGASMKLWRYEIALPTRGAIFGQIVISLIDIMTAALCLWLLLPAGKPDFASFVAIFAAASMVGVLSHVPGGVGVFETMIIAALPGHVDIGHVAAALLLYRAVYYVLPFALAFLVVSLNELRLASGKIGQVPAALRPAYDALSGLAPTLVSATAFGFGVFLLLIALVPSLQTGAMSEGEIAAAILLEGGAIMAAVAGVILLILSHALARRVAAAFWLMLIAMAGGVVAATLNGIDVEGVLILIGGALALLPFRREFYRRAKLTDGVFSPAWFIIVTAVVFTAAVFFFYAHRATPYSNALWVEFGPNADTPRSLRAGLIASAAMLFFSIYLALQPSRRSRHDICGPEAIDRAAAIVARNDEPQSCLALSGDKRLMFPDEAAPEADGFIMFGRQRSAWVAFGDPVGPPDTVADLAWRFFEEAQRANCRPVFYEVSDRNLPLWIEMGLSLHKVGEEAVVNLPEFSLAGAKFKSMRAAFNKKQREGLAIEVLPPPHSDALLDELRHVSDAWLGGKTGREKGFSVGRFERDYLNRFPIAVVRREGHILAFANIMAPGSGRRVAIDLMRYLPHEASGMMDFLFLSLIEHYREAGAEEFSLGVAPLSGLSDRRTARMWNRFGRMMFRHGGAFYNFEGLRAFKQKFRPDWRPRYIALPPGYSPMVAMADVALLIAGGPRGILGK